MDFLFGHGAATRWACWLKRMARHAVWTAVGAAFAADLWPGPAGPARCVRFGAVWAALGASAVYLDRKAGRGRLARKTLRGTRELSPKDFTRSTRGDGLGIPYLAEPGFWGKVAGGRGQKRHLRIRAKDEPSHVLIAGDTGVGKSTLMHDFLCQIAEGRPEGDALGRSLPFPAGRTRGVRTGESVIVYDPALEFWECHARPARGDVLLHPLYAGCPYWDLAGEIATPLDCSALATSFLPNKVEGREEFWDWAPRQVLSFLLGRLAAEEGTVADLLRWLEDPGVIDGMAAGTALAPLIDPQAAPQRAGVLASLNKIAEALKLLPPCDGRPRFSFRGWEEARWGKEGRPWVFVGSRPRERDALRPLVSAWLDTAFSNLLTRVGGPRTWVFVDELPTLQRLPKLQGAVQEARKYNASFVLGFQGRAQLEQHYGKVAETLMSAPATRVFLRTGERGAAEWCAGNIGQPELERGTESLTTSAGAARDSMSTGTERRADYLVLPNEIQTLPERTGYLRYGGHVVKFHFGYRDFPDRNVFREREFRPPPPPRLELAAPAPGGLRLFAESL